jgi:hypothetical protein
MGKIEYGKFRIWLTDNGLFLFSEDSTTQVKRNRFRKYSAWDLYLTHTVDSQWQTSQSNIQRTNAIIKKLASMFKQSTVVSAIAPLNEYVIAGYPALKKSPSQDIV